jgi:hypothetical protein
MGGRRHTYAADHVCEAPDCTNPSPTSRTCSNACRAKVWKSEYNYVERRRGVRNASQRRRERHQARYLILHQDGPNLTITGAILAESKRAAERRVDDPDAIVLAASHLPAKVCV